MDASNLIMDGGAYRRTGVSAGGDGGGILMLSTFNDDNNLARLGSPRINVEIKNGGELENNGQFWFGADDEHSPDTRVKVTINNGTIDLTGGTIPLTNSTLSVVADIAFFYDYSEALARPKNEEYEVHFTGPGSITVDSAGIDVYQQDSDSLWSEVATTYEDLWNLGILKADGMSGQTGSVPNGGGGTTARTPATFSDFFTVTGTAGTDNYKLERTLHEIDTVEWVGAASGEWRDANSWRNNRTSAVGDAAAILGSGNGSEGANSTNPNITAARHIVIGGGDTVEYYWPTNGDFRIRQGSSMTIKDGATWIQETDNTYTENGWTRMDASNLIMDGGHYKRTGVSAGGDGGGILMFSTFNDDNNLARLGSPRINVEIKNGGSLENNGQMWFGADDEHSPDTRVAVTINEGTIDLTGGTIPLTNSTLSVVADLAFFYDYSEALGRPKNEEYSINFTGPGSITVDSAGIDVYQQDSDSLWTDVATTYEDLWALGILQANGLSGKTGSVPNGGGGTTALTPATFSDFFSVTGTPGSDNYILNSLIEASPDPEDDADADYNGDGTIDAGDYVAWRKLPGNFGGDPAGYDAWRMTFGEASPGAGGGGSGGVPEPASMMLAFLGLAAVAFFRTRSR
jgi:hypothetical protein